MHNVLEFLVRHGYLVLLVWVFVEQAGLPIPSLPLLLAAGALSGIHRMNFFVALGACLIGAVVADSMWYNSGSTKAFGSSSSSAEFLWSRILAFAVHKGSSRNKARVPCSSQNSFPA